MRSADLLVVLAGLFASQAMAAILPMYLGRREAFTNYALAPAQQYHGGPGGSSSAVSAVSAASTPTAAVPSAASVAASSASTPVTATSTTVPAPSSSGTSPAPATGSYAALTALGFKNAGTNAVSNNGLCWIGSDGPNVNTVKNAFSSSIYFVLWGVQSSDVTSSYQVSFMTGNIAPLVIMQLNAGQSVQISCANVISGSMSAVYPDTVLTSNGQIQNTWVEFTWGQYGTVDISREIYMNGHTISSSSPACTADMSTCSFVCKSGITCGANGTYTLENCSGPNQQSADGATSGGCYMGANAQVTTTFS